MFAATGATALIYGPEVVTETYRVLTNRFKGGKQSSRDRDYGLPADFWDWWHNGGGKKKNGGEDIGTGEGQLSPGEALEQWEGLGKPRGSKPRETNQQDQ